jgi:probable HAF family extracellular repeat protein
MTLLSALFLGLGRLTVAAAAPVPLDLGTLGGSQSFATAINDSGQVVGWADTGTQLHPFLWTATGGMTDLGTLGGSSGVAVAINKNGQVVGNSYNAGGAGEAFSWTAAGGMVNLGTLGGCSGGPPTQTCSSATGVNDFGQVVGTGYTAAGMQHAFSWTAAGGMVDLGTLGGPYSSAAAVNNNGQIVGSSYTAAGQGHAFLWSAAGGMVDLGDMGTGQGSQGTALNDGGQVVGIINSAFGRNQHAFSWTAGGGMIDLGTLCGSGNSGADAVNNYGQVVGWAYSCSPGMAPANHAFSWTVSGGMIDLCGTNSCINNGGQSEAMAVNTGGEAVGYGAGTYFNAGNGDAFSWTQTGGMVDLGNLGNVSRAEAINSVGQAVGFAQISINGSCACYEHAVLFQTASPTSSSMQSSTDPSTYGHDVVLTATVSPQSGSQTPTGTFNFVETAPAPNTMCSAVAVGSNGQAQCDLGSRLQAGTYVYYAAYSPAAGAPFTGSQSANLTQTVNPAALTVAAASQSMTYGGTVPVLTYSITGYVNADTSSVVSGSASCTTAATLSSQVGTYPINCTLGSLAANNYSFSFVNGTLAVDPAVLTVTADNQTMSYGAPIPVLTYTVAGLVNADTPSVIAGVSCTSTAGSHPAVGTYSISCSGGTAANYSIVYVTGTLTVFSNPPVVGPITVPADPQAIATGVSASAGFTDVANVTPLSAVWTWGDGTTSAGTLAGTSMSGTVTGSHTYAAPGVYTVTVTVTNGAGQTGSATATTYVVVYDPTGGFVTGGGWVNSAAGAYTSDPSLTGRAEFGFNSRYAKGATVPTGDTEFQFQIGSLDFKSEAYQWLVLSGSKAQYKGTGSINGTSGYSFLLTACDVAVNGSCAGGSVDTFRIKIWNTATGTLAYDNAPGPDDLTSNTEAIGGGNIVIHKS